MAKSKVTSGMWRIDPQKMSRVVDRCGLPVASVDAETEANANASLIAAAPDMFELLESLEVNTSIPEEVVEEIKIVLRRARGDFGLAIFSRSAKRIFRARTQDWMKFMEGLWNSDRIPTGLQKLALSCQFSLLVTVLLRLPRHSPACPLLPGPGIVIVGSRVKMA